MTGEKLKEVLLCFKVSQTDIAKKIGMSQQSLNQMLGASDVKSGLLEKIANAVNVSVSRLYELACCSSATDAEIFGSPSASATNASTDLQRTHSEGATDLAKENTMLKELLAEKERTIQILLKNKQ